MTAQISDCNNLPCGCAHQEFDVVAAANGDAYATFDSWLSGSSVSGISIQTDQATLAVPSGAGNGYGPSGPGGVATGSQHSTVRLPGPSTTFPLPLKQFGTYTGSFVAHAVTPINSQCQTEDFPYSSTLTIGPPSITSISVNRAAQAQKLEGPNAVVARGKWFVWPYTPGAGNVLVTKAALLQSDGVTPVSGATATFSDWLQKRTRDIFDSASAAQGDVATVLSAISSYTMAPLNVSGTFTNWASQSPVQINPYQKYHRLDSGVPGLCETPAATKGLTDTLLHEGQHAYQGAQASIPDNDGDRDWLVVAIGVPPLSLFLDNDDHRNGCNDTVNALGDVVNDIWFHGDNISDGPDWGPNG